MTYKDFIRIFDLHVSTLEYRQQFELCISICKTLFSDYKDFCQENSWGDLDILIDAIQFCELYNDGKITSIESLKETLLKVEAITPDTDDFEMASYALNACTAVSETLEFLMDNNRRHVLNVGSFFTDTIDARIQENVGLNETQINKHPAMIEARNFLLATGDKL